MKKSFLISIMLLFSVVSGSPAESATPYAVALFPTPVLNTPDFAGVFGESVLRTDSCGQFRSLEFVALPGTAFRVVDTVRNGNEVVYRVTTDDYPYPSTTGYFIDSRFVTTTSEQPPARPRHLPPRASVIVNLLALRGSAYVWGGNVLSGLPKMLSFFPPSGAAPPDPKSTDLRQLRGVDCSGLLYEATGGYTPRNTSALVDFGEPVRIAGLSTAEIVHLMKPLDLIVWAGHVLVALDRERVIESHLDCSGDRGGVRVRPLRTALDEIMKNRIPVDDAGKAAALGIKGFVVRRWYGQ